jgi:hypothetical protein
MVTNGADILDSILFKGLNYSMNKFNSQWRSNYAGNEI